MKLKRFFENNSNDMSQDDMDRVIDAFHMYVCDKGRLFEYIENYDLIDSSNRELEIGKYAYRVVEGEMDLILLRPDLLFSGIPDEKKIWGEDFKNDIIEFETRLVRFGYNVDTYYYAYFCELTISKDEIEIRDHKNYNAVLPGYDRYRYNGKARFTDEEVESSKKRMEIKQAHSINRANISNNWGINNENLSSHTLLKSDVDNIIDLFYLYCVDEFHMFPASNSGPISEDESKDFKSNGYFKYDLIDFAGYKDRILEINVIRGNSWDLWQWNKKIGEFIKRLNQFGFGCNTDNISYPINMFKFIIFKTHYENKKSI